MASKVEIANMALLEIGADRITSFSDGTRSATLINSIFEMIVDEVVSTRDWSKAAARAELAQTTAPDFGWTYAYQLPTSPLCLKVRTVTSNLCDDIEYEIEGDKLLTDETSINLVYTKQLTSSSDYGPYITICVYKRLAAAICFNLTGDRGMEQTKMAEYLKSVMMYYAEDSIQQKMGISTSDALTSIRN